MFESLKRILVISWMPVGWVVLIFLYLLLLLLDFLFQLVDFPKGLNDGNYVHFYVKFFLRLQEFSELFALGLAALAENSLQKQNEFREEHPNEIRGLSLTAWCRFWVWIEPWDHLQVETELIQSSAESPRNSRHYLLTSTKVSNQIHNGVDSPFIELADVRNLEPAGVHHCVVPHIFHLLLRNAPWNA